MPLVPLGWALLIDRENGPPGSAIAQTALFLTVWVLYIADRLFDTFRSNDLEKLPPRHRFARRHRRGLAAVGSILFVSLLTILVPKLDREILIAGIALGLLTLFYFLVFRLRRTPSRFPAKEFVIGLCFAIGVLIAARQLEISIPTALHAAALAPLFTANCLAISLAESGYDSVSDPAAHFAERPSSKKLPLALLILSLLAATALLFQTGFQNTAVSAILGAVLTASIVIRTSDNSDWVQPVADAVLLVPWLLIVYESTG